MFVTSNITLGTPIALLSRRVVPTPAADGRCGVAVLKSLDDRRGVDDRRIDGHSGTLPRERAPIA